MKRNRIKKTLLWSGGIFLFLVMVLAVHIYIVTRPKAPTEHTRIMARIDIKQPISQDESNKITTWLYQQQGVDHVLCNQKTDIVVFTFSPLKANANEIASNFKSALNYPNAQRYIPTEAEMQGGCPVATTSFSYKMYKMVKNIF